MKPLFSSPAQERVAKQESHWNQGDSDKCACERGNGHYALPMF
jgi:hypothetical protein